MRPLKRRERGIRKVKTGIDGPGGKLKLIVLRYGRGPGILWIHGGGYALGTAGMVYASMGRILARRFCGTVVSPEYRLAGQAPYPAALEDCWAALKYMYESAGELGIDRKRIVVGGESAGGGLAAALCLYARDRGEIPIAFQIPLYPMLDCEDTDSSGTITGMSGTRSGITGDGASISAGCTARPACRPTRARPARRISAACRPATLTWRTGSPFMTKRWRMCGS